MFWAFLTRLDGSYHKFKLVLLLGCGLCCWLCCWLCGGGLSCWLSGGLSCNLLHDLLLLLGSLDCRLLSGQRFCSFDGFAVECSVLRGSALQLLVSGGDDAVLRALDEAELESLEVVEVWALKKWEWTWVICKMSSTLRWSTYLSLCASTFSPQCLSPFLLNFEILEGFLDDASRCCEGELDDELGQMQVADWVLLSGNARQWTIDEDLKVDKNVPISWWNVTVEVKSLVEVLRRK